MKKVIEWTKEQLRSLAIGNPLEYWVDSGNAWVDSVTPFHTCGHEHKSYSINPDSTTECIDCYRKRVK